MAKIDGVPDLLNALRSQLAGRANKAGSASSGRTRNLGEAAAAPQRQVSVEVLQERIGGQLKLVSLISSGGRKQGRQIFLESVLAWDLGEELLADSQFSRVVRDVEESIAADSRLSDQLDQLVAKLKGPVDSGA